MKNYYYLSNHTLSFNYRFCSTSFFIFVFLLLNILIFQTTNKAFSTDPTTPNSSSVEYEDCRKNVIGDKLWHTENHTEINKQWKSFITRAKDVKTKEKLLSFIEDATATAEKQYKCYILDALTSVDSSLEIPESEQYQPKSSGMMMMAGMGGMGGGMGGMGGASAIPGQAGGMNPMMMMMMSGGLSCKSKGRQTQDYKYCKELLQLYDVIMITQMGAQQIEKTTMEFQKLESQKQAMAANGTDPTIALKQLRDQMKTAAIIASTRAGQEMSKSVALGLAAQRLPGKKRLIDTCKKTHTLTAAHDHIVKEYKKAIEEARKSYNCSKEDKKDADECKDFAKKQTPPKLVQ
ncbi:MAG: hypothetical protein HQK49_07010 [Oligoflexia bacterium]|nr:hypothetical protein [Oligoflexia bacterium]